MRHTHHHGNRRRGQRGLTLIEFMVSIALGMLIVAALATLIADQSSNRAEVERAGRLIENGRYAVRAMADDLQMAGYWGELTTAPSAPAALPDPCSTTEADVASAIALHVQGYNVGSTTTPVTSGTVPGNSQVASCLSDVAPNTDILVVRHADPDTSSLETAGAPDLAKMVNGQLYVQTGLVLATKSFDSRLHAGASASNSTNFPLLKKDLTTPASFRKVVVHIYYISQCSVQSGGSCAAGDGGNPIPTLKMVELTVAGGLASWNTVTIAEGIENLQVDYGVDTDANGSPDGTDVSGSALTKDTWPDVMTAKVYLLARSTDKTPGFTDTKTYPLGTAGTVTPATADQGYKRHVFVQSVRLVNPSARRVS
ncbi:MULTISPECIES: PilW family protein [Ramlibacter]|uniref:Pilus assembly protein PilW n=1 Tax=Ramlibacter pinisoli TaxID=2682844 RepID=A0A6N8INJ1_9BURK|nr:MULTISPECIES: PilW family protein [Ramlibacter]MBA2963472.1 PilW family protein [Ramlibacter sp. CGMCC 1.13660]MVQ28439.1 pilus assembly protein PilW [Ramlibacter pinisoli]